MQLSKINQTDLYNNKIKLKFTSIFLQFINAAEKGEILTPAGETYKPVTIRMYRQTYRILQEYEKKHDTIFLNDLTPFWAEMFLIFLKKYNVSKSTTSRHLTRIKAVLNRAYKAGLTLRTGYGITASTERPFTVFNTIEDLKALNNLNLSESPGLDRIRDIYIMNCFMGMRFSDLRRFIANPKNYLKYVNGKFFIEFDALKSNNKSVIPLSAMVKYILRKWNYDFGKQFSAQYFNFSIKKLGSAAKLDEKYEVYRTIGGEKKKFEYVKWQKMSSHTARRTFVSLCVLSNMNQQNIMKLTGHQSETSFQGYVRITHLQSAIKISENPFFKIKL